jgi:hypothetical protein
MLSRISCCVIAVCLLASFLIATAEEKAPPAAQASSVGTNAPGAKYDVKGPDKKKGMDVYTITSDYQKGPCDLYVQLPDGFDKSKQYKVLYILPCFTGGSPGLDEAKKLNLINKYNIIGVYPGYSTYPSVNGPWYGDNPTDSVVRCDSYLTDIIVPFIDKTYPTIAKPEGRVVVGFSKSGVGAMQVFLRHIDVFGRVGAWDAPLLTDDSHHEYFGPSDYFNKNFSVSFLLNKRLDVLKDKPARIAIAGPGPKGSMTGSSGAHELMIKLGISHYSNMSLGGAHAWTSGWLGPMVDVLMSEDMTKVESSVEKKQ